MPLSLRDKVAVMVVDAEGLSGWSIPKANQDEPYDQTAEPQTDTHSLQRPEPAPFPGAKDVHRDDAGKADHADGDDEKTELAFGDHVGWDFNPSMR